MVNNVQFIKAVIQGASCRSLLRIPSFHPPTTSLCCEVPPSSLSAVTHIRAAKDRGSGSKKRKRLKVRRSNLDTIIAGLNTKWAGSIHKHDYFLSPWPDKGLLHMMKRRVTICVRIFCLGVFSSCTSCLTCHISGLPPAVGGKTFRHASVMPTRRWHVCTLTALHSCSRWPSCDPVCTWRSASYSPKWGRAFIQQSVGKGCWGGGVF